MQIVCSSPESAYTLAKRILFLAYEASQVFGMGVFKAEDGITEDQVWTNVLNKGDYPGRCQFDNEKIYADYVFGRMMKTRFVLNGNTISYNGVDKPHCDFQSWSIKYNTYTKLFQAALKSLNMTTPIDP